MRSRNLKSGTYENPILNRLPADHRWLFLGLGPIADRRGLVEDRPMKIADQIMRGLDTDVNAALDTLASMVDDDGTTLITRYVGANGVRVIKITKFLRHNNPHCNEPENQSLCDSDGSTGKARCKHSVSTVHARDMHRTGTLLTPDSGLLTPDCGLLTDDCSPAESSTESAALSPLLAAPVTIPVREGDEPISQTEIDAWQGLYGNVRVLDELRAMSGYWGAVDTTRRKTRKGIRRSIVTWLAKNHDRAHGGGPGSAAQFGIDGRAARTKAALAEVLKEMNGGGNGRN